MVHPFPSAKFQVSIVSPRSWTRGKTVDEGDDMLILNVPEVLDDSGTGKPDEYGLNDLNV